MKVPELDALRVTDQTVYEWRALGVDDGPEGYEAEIISGPRWEREALDLRNDGEPPYDKIVVQRRAVGQWEIVEDAVAAERQRGS